LCVVSVCVCVCVLVLPSGGGLGLGRRRWHVRFPRGRSFAGGCCDTLERDGCVSEAKLWRSRKHTHAHIHTRIHTHTYTHTQTQIIRKAHTHTNTYTHTHTHTHTTQSVLQRRENQWTSLLFSSPRSTHLSNAIFKAQGRLSFESVKRVSMCVCVCVRVCVCECVCV